MATAAPTFTIDPLVHGLAAILREHQAVICRHGLVEELDALMNGPDLLETVITDGAQHIVPGEAFLAFVSRVLLLAGVINPSTVFVVTDKTDSHDSGRRRTRKPHRGGAEV